ncbi:MAG: hypothetical protein A2951_02520 [Candidatus Buchananbacteria bacterium RIFCSPLOWO2_01_FULL_56_15]|uniref:Peptidase M50 domain-containing protein n=2 Tax=Candidatus Buchananiibacteriota TaxID=1817903 RepID=A0A1G1YJK5_9BACT|nr:MAG: hypothetical protein A3J59_02105 [Candidatus Buchananbacteria bacterium RIFCSPHIGHO2_02_FULL_56_16]OGY54984.1 MAG: hypothetical protein A2951_02520 [Candidatus Buchananbacteria bacterium RIFCSPLOWO2_01_FULL_56_15]
MTPELIPIFIIVFLASVILHEVAHGYVAYRFGDDTARLAGRLSLNPLVHIDPFGSILVPLLLLVSRAGFLFGWAKPVPVNPYRLRGGARAYRWVALAGIGTNLCLALVAAGVLKVVTTVLELPTQNLGVIFFGLAFYLNVILALFNALPFPGFDGFNFLTTFSAFGNFISKTPLGDPLFMVRYGLLLSLALLYLFSTTVSRLIIYVLAWLANFFGITDVLASVLTYF